LKINYYCHFIEHSDTQEQYLFDIKPFLKAFTNWETSIEIAKRLTRDGEHLYLLPVEGKKNYYLFVETKENDAIQKIKTSVASIDSSQIIDELQKEDSTIGFASYIFFDEKRNLFSFTSRQNSPRAEAFRNFMNDLFGKLGLGRLDFKIFQLKDNIPKTSVANLPFIGKTSITVNKDSELFEYLAEYLIENSADRSAIETLEVTIKPASRQNINDSVTRAINKVKQQGLEGIRLKAKRTIDNKEPLKEYFINESGAIFDEIDSLDTHIIYEYMSGFLKTNTILETKIQEHEGKYEFSTETLTQLTEYNKPEKWKDR